MEENEDKKPEGDEPEVPEGTEEKPVDSGSEQPKEKGGKLDAVKAKAKAVKDKAKEKAKVVKQKTGEFMGVKRNRIIVLACSGAAIIALVVGLSVGLTQCHGSNGGDTTSSSSGESKGGEGGSSSAHTHEYGTAWKSDATQHWHECACGDKKDAANHTFGSELEIITPASETTAGKKAYKCSVCSYLKDEVVYTPYISEANFADAFKFEGDKYTATVALDAEGGEWKKTIKNGNTIHLSSSRGDSQERYFTKEGSGDDAKYYYFAKNDSGTWIKYEDAKKNYETLASFDANKSAFDSKLTHAGLTFDKAKGGYTGSYVNNQSTNVGVELYFNNGKITNGVKSYGEKSYNYTFSDEAEAIALPSYEAHVHQFGAAWEIKTKATSAAKGIKAHKCSVCGAFDEATQKEYDPYMDRYNWSQALEPTGDFTLHSESFSYSGFGKENRHMVETTTKHGDLVKLIYDWYDYNNESLFDSYQRWYAKTASSSASYGYEYSEYRMSEDSAAWEKIGLSENGYETVSEPYIEGYDEAITDYTFNEALECYERKNAAENLVSQIYFESGKAYKAYYCNSGDGKNYDTWEVEYSSPELSLPDPDTHEHSWSTEYSSDYLYHWHECACGARNEKSAHNFSGFAVTKSATETENGTKSSPCSTCSGSSGEREYTPYLNTVSGWSWSAAFADYNYSYSVNTTQYKADDMEDNETVTFNYKSRAVYRSVVTQNPSSWGGQGVEEAVTNNYYTNGSVYSQVYDSATKTNSWTKTSDGNSNYAKYSKLSVFASYASLGIDEFQIVKDGDATYYTKDDNSIKLYFDMGRIVKLEDSTGTYKKVITVSYSNLYEIALPTVA